LRSNNNISGGIGTSCNAANWSWYYYGL